MHIYTHNAIHIYCLHIYIYILHSDTQHLLLVSVTKVCFAPRPKNKTKKKKDKWTNFCLTFDWPSYQNVLICARWISAVGQRM